MGPSGDSVWQLGGERRRFMNLRRAFDKRWSGTTDRTRRTLALALGIRPLTGQALHEAANTFIPSTPCTLSHFAVRSDDCLGAVVAVLNLCETREHWPASLDAVIISLILNAKWSCSA